METASLLEELHLSFPQFTFLPSKQAYWSPESKEVYYDTAPTPEAIWSLLHELGHATLNHQSYSTDIDLLKKEVAAWLEANLIAKKLGLVIDEDYTQNCLETYRNWQYKRSICPSCGTHGIQNDTLQYFCLNCGSRWSVNMSRFCRPYRGKAAGNARKKSQESNPWLF
jgi:hypothetical protein